MRREAIDEALPDAVQAALAEAGLEPAVTPKVVAVRDVEDGVEAEVRVTMWPEAPDLPAYRGRRIVVDSPLVSEADVDAHVERLRLQFAELDDVDREGFDGDFALIDLRTRSGEAEVAAARPPTCWWRSGRAPSSRASTRRCAARRRATSSSSPPPSQGDGRGGREVGGGRVLVKQVKARRLPR